LNLAFDLKRKNVDLVFVLKGRGFRRAISRETRIAALAAEGNTRRQIPDE
jgi:hypothetical protein